MLILGGINSWGKWGVEGKGKFYFKLDIPDSNDKAKEFTKQACNLLKYNTIVQVDLGQKKYKQFILSTR